MNVGGVAAQASSCSTRPPINQKSTYGTLPVQERMHMLLLSLLFDFFPHTDIVHRVLHRVAPLCPGALVPDRRLDCSVEDDVERLARDERDVINTKCPAEKNTKACTYLTCQSDSLLLMMLNNCPTVVDYCSVRV